MLDDLGREAMAAVAERAHVDILSDTPLASDSVSVTMPAPPFSSKDKIGEPVGFMVDLCREVAKKLADRMLRFRILPAGG